VVWFKIKNPPADKILTMSRSDGQVWRVLPEQTIDIELIWTPGGQHCSTGATHRGVGEQRAQAIAFIQADSPNLSIAPAWYSRIGKGYSVAWC
jgi:hypothetical protein